MVREGHEVTILEIAGFGLPRHDKEIGVQVLPAVRDRLGNDTIIEDARRTGAQAVITLTDAFGINPAVAQQLPLFPYTPVDHTPVPPAVQATLRASQKPIAMSQFGIRELRQVGFDPYYVPHAYSRDVFHPIPQAQARQQIGIDEDAFLALFVGVNDSVPSRKGIPELLMAWQVFSARHPDAVLYMHTSKSGNLALDPHHGVHIDAIMRTLGIDPRTLRFPDAYAYDRGIPQSYLASVYSAGDVLVLAGEGEGFGVPLIEAQACGTPVITTDFGGGAELCASGWLVEYEPVWTWQSAFMAKPSIQGIIDRLEQAYEARGDIRLRSEAIAFARGFELDRVYQLYFRPVLADIADRVTEALL